MSRFGNSVGDKVNDLNRKDFNAQVNGLYTGVVLVNNDPQQMGRCRIQIHGIDEEGLDIQNYRWTPILTSLAGVQVDVPIGPEKQNAAGITSYGRFEIPKVGSIVLIMFIGGRLTNPVILGCIYPNDLISGLPGGNRGKNELDVNENNQNIPRLVDRLDLAFGTSDSTVKETRGFEVTARARGERTGIPDVSEENLKTGDITSDRKKAGYPEVLGFDPEEGPDNEPMMYSYTTPGQNTIIMNDDPDNFRIRLRTLSGNQVILDDTNQRIYISTGRGNNYIEMDEDGHIDIYASHRVSIHSEQDINLKSDQQVNIEGTDGINLKSDKDINIQSGASISQKAATAIYLNAAGNYHVDAAAVFIESTSGDINLLAAASYHLDAAAVHIESTSGDINLRALGDLLETATAIQMNGPPATPATPVAADPAGTANSVNRIPLHEANDWRSISATGLRSDAVLDAKVDKAATNVYSNKAQGGKLSISRPDNWRK